MLLTFKLATVGVLVGMGLVFGAFVGKRIVDRLPKATFVALVEVALVIAGIRLLVP